jgi:diphthine synthase
MLYIIGLGLNARGISKEGVAAVEKCKKIYLENYTVEFPYGLESLHMGQEVIRLERKDVESNKLIKEAKSIHVALLVYGCPLFATTHTSLVLDARAAGIEVKVIQAASVFDAIGETGLQLYKFGKIASMPAWTDKYQPDFLEYVEQNLSIKAHSLILIDIGLKFEKALTQLETAAKNRNMKLEKIIVCRKMGTDWQKVIYNSIENLRHEEVRAPYCIIIPSELHFMEKEFLESLRYI